MLVPLFYAWIISESFPVHISCSSRKQNWCSCSAQAVGADPSICNSNPRKIRNALNLFNSLFCEREHIVESLHTWFSDILANVLGAISKHMLMCHQASRLILATYNNHSPKGLFLTTFYGPLCLKCKKSTYGQLVEKKKSSLDATN